MNVKFPNMRDELRDWLSFLADAAYQNRAWAGGDFSSGIASFDDIVHFIFDDTKLSRNADDCIGMFLRNEDEAAVMRDVVEAIDAILNTYGSSLTDAEYIAKPEWQHVLATAQAALAVLNATPPEAPG